MKKRTQTTTTRRSSDKFWIVFFVVLAALCALAIGAMHWFPHGQVAVIYTDGEVYAQIDLSAVRESYTIELAGNTILVEPDGISMQSANCPDQICVHQGKIRAAGQITCLPNRVQIVIRSGKDAPDAKVG